MKWQCWGAKLCGVCENNSGLIPQGTLIHKLCHRTPPRGKGVKSLYIYDSQLWSQGTWGPQNRGSLER